MSEPIQPRFLPWLRTGLAAQIDVRAQSGLAPHDSVTIPTSIELHAGGASDLVETVPGPNVRLRGPGDVVGLDPALVVRQDPAPGASDAEGIYFALVEFSAPDLPWRYTPAAATKGQLQPWIALVVVEERVGVRLDAGGANRLPILTVDDPGRELPDLSGCWAWAHVHADHDLAGGVAAAYRDSPQAFRSRLLCPRRLPPRRSWIACVVPTFEAGRKAGLGETVLADMGLAWDVASSEEVRLPVYLSWRFQTGPGGDFESLVRRLTPRTLPAGIGRRDLDISTPGGGIPASLRSVITYEGALLSPAGDSRPWPPRERAAMKAALRGAVNTTLVRSSVPDDYNALRDDPVVGPPAYGATQAAQSSVPAANDSPQWFGTLNTEPQYRTVAGVAAEVIRRDQEALMATAWSYAADAREATRVLSRARVSWEVARQARPAFDRLSDERFVQMAGPAMARLAHSPGLTVLGAVETSALPSGLISPAFKRFASTIAVRGSRNRKPPTEAVTKAALDNPVAFVGSWADVWPPAGSETSGGATARRRRRVSRSRGLPGASASRRAVDLNGTVLYELTIPVRDRLATLPYSGAVSNVATLAADTRRALDSLAAITTMVNARVAGLAPDRTDDVPDRVFVTPVFRNAMHRRLTALSVEYMVPGIGEVPDDTLGLLETNPPFVEAFLVGLNHEMGREFLWREYPARLDGTWFRRFWEGGADGPPDIIPIKLWPGASGLGTHPPPWAPQASLVLLVRSAIVRRYPDIRIYASEARWKDGVRREKRDGDVRVPLFVAQLTRDVTVYGFALDEATARGSTDRDEHPGYFFVLEQPSGSPRFGLDARRRGVAGEAPAKWSDLTWSHLAAGGGTLPQFVAPDGPSWLVDAGPLPGNGPDGSSDAWGDDAAAMARITFQRPVRMLAHADSMLPAAGTKVRT